MLVCSGAGNIGGVSPNAVSLSIISCYFSVYKVSYRKEASKNSKSYRARGNPSLSSHYLSDRFSFVGSGSVLSIHQKRFFWTSRVTTCADKVDMVIKERQAIIDFLAQRDAGLPTLNKVHYTPLTATMSCGILQRFPSRQPQAVVKGNAIVPPRGAYRTTTTHNRKYGSWCDMLSQLHSIEYYFAMLSVPCSSLHDNHIRG